MKIGSFQFHQPITELNEPYVLATLRPWVDVNNVGSLTLHELETRFAAKEIGFLSKPGCFYDFTRYRPIVNIDGGIKEMSIPNTTIHCATREGYNDLLLLNMLEPHANSELYIASVIKFLKVFNVKKYVFLGSMYDTVPHTKPLLVSGYGMGEEALKDVKKAGILPITYSGPSTIINMITKEAARIGIDALALIVSLPQYVVLNEDYMGKVRLMEILNMLYNIPVDKEDFEKALEQLNLINKKIESSPDIRMLLPQLESIYDMRVNSMQRDESALLTPEMEELLWKMTGKNIGKA